jgi:nicotinate-nucleotide--dimethylbenzimidazole phosphoribosyltransferase
MGIGNTSSASALCALLLGRDGSDAVGAGTGATGSLLETKRRVIDAAVRFHRDQWDNTAEDALRRVGGFEIAGMTGYMLGCAARRVPVVVDGFIATAAALCAIKMQPAVSDYLFFGHVSDEQFHKNVLEELGVSAILNLGMRLGEGSGAVLGVQILEQAMNCYHNMATFSSAGVSNRDS